LCKNELSDFQKYILFKRGTEKAFSGKYWNNTKEGSYFCVCCDNLLFDSKYKFDSGTGWPSFWDKSGKIKEYRDISFGMERIEVRCGKCDGHLGHVFNDGVKPTSMRYCINSASLNFIEKK